MEVNGGGWGSTEFVMRLLPPSLTLALSAPGLFSDLLVDASVLATEHVDTAALAATTPVALQQGCDQALQRHLHAVEHLHKGGLGC